MFKRMFKHGFKAMLFHGFLAGGKAGAEGAECLSYLFKYAAPL